MAMQRRPAELAGVLSQPEPVADIADLMNGWFFGSARPREPDQKPTAEEAYDCAKGVITRPSGAGRSTLEWLADAKRMVDESPSGRESPARFVGSPRFAAASRSSSPTALLDRRDALSRSARRQRSLEGIGDEILSKSARHGRTRSEAFVATPSEKPPVAAVEQGCKDTLPHKHAPPAAGWSDRRDNPDDRSGGNMNNQSAGPANEQLSSAHRSKKTSRFGRASNLEEQQPARQQPIPRPGRTQLRSPEEGLHLLSPPKNLVESAHRRTISSSTCTVLEEKRSRTPASTKSSAAAGSTPAEHEEEAQEVEQYRPDAQQLNSFLRRQRGEVERISRGESSARAKIILSGPSFKSTTSSMVAAICYAWLLEVRDQIKRDVDQAEGGSRKERGTVVAPVINVRREKMWEHQQAAWLFQHVGIDASALLFADEIDLEGLVMARQLSMPVVGHDILKTNSKVGSHCTILTNDYCEDAYDLLQMEVLKKLLLAGILLDMQNLRNAANFLTKRDTEAVQLLLAGFAPSFKEELLEQLMREHDDSVFIKAMRRDYGKGPNNGMQTPQARPAKQPQANNNNITSARTAETTAPSNGKSKSFWGIKWFGFKSK